jgi:hypothetical protein
MRTLSISERKTLVQLLGKILQESGNLPVSSTAHKPVVPAHSHV